MKKSILLLLCLLTLLASQVCNAQTEMAAEAPQYRTVIDHAGFESQVPTEINRIVIGNSMPLCAILAIYLNSAEPLVGIHPIHMSAAENSILSELYPEILDAETGYIKGNELNIEEVLRLNPDIVIGASGETADKLRAAGVPAITVSASDWNFDPIETYKQWIRLFDQIFGKEGDSDIVFETSTAIYDDIQERVSEIEEADRKKILFLFQYTDTAIQVSGPKHFGQYWATAAGGINVGQDLDGSAVVVNMEQVYAWNPDIIFISNFTPAQPEDLYTNAIANDVWDEVNAVKNHQVYKMPLGLYRTYVPGPDTPITLQWLAKTVYPELFEDLDITEAARSYYGNVYGVDLTDEQIDAMFNPPSNAANGMRHIGTK